MAKKDKKNEMQRLCETMGVKKLYYNSKGEYFTNESYARMSEGGDVKKVGCYLNDSDGKAEEPEAAAGDKTSMEGKAAEKENKAVAAEKNAEHE